jgi:hypothetical protein
MAKSQEPSQQKKEVRVVEQHSDGAYVRIEHDRYVPSECRIVLPNGTVEHMICYPPRRFWRRFGGSRVRAAETPSSLCRALMAKEVEANRLKTHGTVMAQELEACSLETYEDRLSTDEKLGSRSCMSVASTLCEDGSQTDEKSACGEKTACGGQARVPSIQPAPEVKQAVNRIDSKPPQWTNTGLLPAEQWMSEDRRTWIGVYDLPDGSSLKRTSVRSGVDILPRKAKVPGKVVGCTCRPNGKGLVRLFYSQARPRFWRGLFEKLSCMQ